jgi:hypothetical protein
MGWWGRTMGVAADHCNAYCVAGISDSVRKRTVIHHGLCLPSVAWGGVARSFPCIRCTVCRVTRAVQKV